MRLKVSSVRVFERRRFITAARACERAIKKGHASERSHASGAWARTCIGIITAAVGAGLLVLLVAGLLAAALRGPGATP